MNTHRIRGFAVAGAAALLLGGGALTFGATAAQGSSGPICGSQGSSLASGIASRRIELQQGLIPALSGIQIRSLVGGGASALDCTDQAEKVAPVPVVSGEVQQPAWLIREMAGGPPHCSVV